MCIEIQRSFYGSMPKKNAYRLYIHSQFNHPGGKGVPEGMKMNIVDLQPQRYLAKSALDGSGICHTTISAKDKRLIATRSMMFHQFIPDKIWNRQRTTGVI